MVGEILRKVTESEAAAEQIIEDAKKEAASIKASAKTDIAEAEKKDEESFMSDADAKRAAVKEEEDRKDKEYTLEVNKELEALASVAAGKEESIIAHLSQLVLG